MDLKTISGKHIKALFCILMVFIIVCSLVFPCFAEETAYVWSNISENTVDENNKKTDENAVVSTNAEVSDDNSLGLESGSAILIEQNSGKVLYSHNVHEQLRPASVTKVMSILLIMEELNSGRISATDQVPCSETASAMGGSQIWLDTTETLSVEEMLKAICVVSANDCVVAMAEYIAGSQEAFVQMMNDKAKELGMNDTCFKNCHGIDEDGHVTSAYDISIMSRELLTKFPEITKYTSIYMDSLRDGKSELVNTNKLVRNYSGCTGLKTGSTSLALYNLSASATRNDLSLIAVIMRAPTTKIRFAEAQKLLDYGFSKFEYKQFGKTGDFVQNVTVSKGVTSNVNGILENDSGVLMQKGASNEISQEVTIDNNISAPIEKGQKIGEMSYYSGDELLATVNIVADNNIEKLNIFTMAKRVYYSWVGLLR